ncbi:hypothetical protein MANES_01G119450v8 [Manihot esculenta]|uniref:SBP-type domain-containing protein n=1 Tax=Manihot esculenta TaxID=3983 RepID=A0A2C9WPX6_MANES|nr:hypothetical protein MANES_01G119450v8 [Manihot esculenta]
MKNSSQLLLQGDCFKRKLSSALVLDKRCGEMRCNRIEYILQDKAKTLQLSLPNTGLENSTRASWTANGQPP